MVIHDRTRLSQILDEHGMYDDPDITTLAIESVCEEYHEHMSCQHAQRMEHIGATNATLVKELSLKDDRRNSLIKEFASDEWSAYRLGQLERIKSLKDEIYREDRGGVKMYYHASKNEPCIECESMKQNPGCWYCCPLPSDNIKEQSCESE